MAFAGNLFFINIIFIFYNFFLTILNLFSWNLNTFTKHIYKKSALVLLAILQSLYVIILFTFSTWTGSLKRTRKWIFYAIYLQFQFSWWSLNSLKIRLAQLKLECLNCQKSDIRTNSPCCNVLLWSSFCFLQVNQQKRIGMVNTNNITYSKQIYKP